MGPRRLGARRLTACESCRARGRVQQIQSYHGGRRSGYGWRSDYGAESRRSIVRGWYALRIGSFVRRSAKAGVMKIGSERKCGHDVRLRHNELG